MNVILKSATIVDNNSKYHLKKQDILIENGVITKIASKVENPKNHKEIILDNLHVSNGWFDTSVSFGEPGYEERENIINGLDTAAKSGFTTVAVNPNTQPKTDNKAAVEFLISKANGSATSLVPIGNLTKNAEGKDLAELYDMQNSGAIAFGDYNKSISNANLFKIALQYAQNFNGLILSFPQDNTIARDGLANEGISSIKIGLKGIPNLAEELQVARDLFLLEYTGGKLHIPTISTAKSVALIAEAKTKGLQVSCSVTAHHLTLPDSILEGFDANTKVTPPIRTQKDIDALIKGVEEGTIDIITSDHNPIDIEHKKLEFNYAKFGTIGLESLFGALNRHISQDVLIKCLTTNPRKIFGLEELHIKEGQKANLTLFNPDIEYTFDEKDILSTSKNAIFLGRKMKGKAYGIVANKKLTLK